jgi:Uma2 family endonuclease
LGAGFWISSAIPLSLSKHLLEHERQLGDYGHHCAAPAPGHIITELIYGLARLYKSGQMGLFPYPETMIDESQTSPVPDVMLVDEETDLTKVIIEIAHTQGVKKDLQKLQELMAAYDVPEGFVYDYRQKRWFRYDLATEQTEPDSSFCAAIGADLDSFLR